VERNLFVNFCIDTEGPLYESLDATFERLEDLLQINVPRTKENLELIKNKKIDLNGKENEAAKILSGHLNQYNTNWSEIDNMLSNVLTKEFRSKFKDSLGNNLILNWFIMDHIGYEINPRRRDIGFHNIYDHYIQILKDTSSYEDGLFWHFHPMSFYKEAHRCATSYTNSIYLYEGLARKIIEREWFPNSFRAGFQTERPDCNLFLEQWIPYDLSNMSKIENFTTSDMEGGRLNDWRWAPDDWSIYHPDHDNYQLIGNMRRYIGRCLNILNRVGNIDEDEVRKAFDRAQLGKQTMLSVAGHDWRDISIEIEEFYRLIYKVSKDYPEVKIINSKVDKSFLNCIPNKNNNSNDKIDLNIKAYKQGSTRLKLEINTISGKVFGPQPFLAIETSSGRFLHDNLDLGANFSQWTYTFDDESIRVEDLKRIGIAANDANGNTFVKVLNYEEINCNEQL